MKIREKTPPLRDVARSRYGRSSRLHAPQIVSLLVAFGFIALGWVGEVPVGLWAQLGLTPTKWWHVVPLALMVIPLLLGVRHPTAALSLGIVIVAFDLTLGFNAGILLCVSDLVYSFALRVPRRKVVITASTLAMFPIAALCLALTPVLDSDDAVSIAMLLFAVLILPIWWASEVRRGLPLWQDHDVQEKLLAERHASVLRAQAAKRRAAIEEERRATARELHDVVSSQVSAIALTSGAVLNAPPDSDRDRQALESVRQSSLDALEQLSEMVRLLRGDTEGLRAKDDTEMGSDVYADLTGTPTWQEVIDRIRSHGLHTVVDGQLPDDLSNTQRHVTLRVLQESLTNALKYGDGAAEVVLRSGKQNLYLRVTSRMGTEPRGGGIGAGTGLIAMQERVERVGGTFCAGVAASDEKVWTVEVTLPYRGSQNAVCSGQPSTDFSSLRTQREDRP